MKHILMAYDLSKETVTAIMMFYKNTKVKFHSPDGDTDFFDIVAGVLRGDTLAPYQFIIYLDYVLRTSIDLIKENGFTLKKARSRRYPAKTITDADYVDDISLLVNTPILAKFLLNRPGSVSRRYWRPCECKQNGVYVLIKKERSPL